MLVGDARHNGMLTGRGRGVMFKDDFVTGLCIPDGLVSMQTKQSSGSGA